MLLIQISANRILRSFKTSVTGIADILKYLRIKLLRVGIYGVIERVFMSFLFSNRT